jgi:hypothetical protein
VEVRWFACGNQPVSWALKSSGEANCRPGMNEVSKYRFVRSTIPLDSGSRGGSCTIRVPSAYWYFLHRQLSGAAEVS